MVRILLILLAVAALIILFGCAFQRKMIFPGGRLSKDHVFSPHKGGVEVWMPAEEGVRLNGILYRNFGSRQLIVFFHGNGGNLESWRYEYDDLEYLRRDVLFVEYRGYGKSEGSISEVGAYRDGRAAFDYARSLGYAEEDIILYGRSMGASVVMDLAQGKRVAAVILESPYASLRGLIYREFWFMLPWFHLRYTFDNCAKAKGVKSPILILHGTADFVVKDRYGKALFDCCGEPKRFVSIPGGGHNDLSAFPEKRQATAAFLDGLPRGVRPE